MKKSGFFAGFLTALILLGIGGTALAYQAQATLDYPGITVTLDGKALDLRDAQGATVEPFTMNDTTYLPVRAISNSLGLGVDWDRTTNTVILTSPDGTTSTASDELWDGLKKLSFYHDLSAAAHFLQNEFERIDSGLFDERANSPASPLYAYFHGDNEKTNLQETMNELSYHDATIESYVERSAWILGENDNKLIDDYKKLSSQIAAYIRAFEAGTTDKLTYDEFDSMNGMVLSDMLFDSADKKFIELMVKRGSWADTTAPVQTSTTEADEWADYFICDCYADFSVPSLENVIGTATLADIYYLEDGDAVGYIYDLSKAKSGSMDNFYSEYSAMLEQFGFELCDVDGEDVTYINRISGIMVNLFPMPDSTETYAVLLMRMSDTKLDEILRN